MAKKHQRPEGALIENALRLKRMSARKAADKAGMSDARWRQIVNGYASAGAGQVVEVRGPDDAIARMARVAGVSADQLREAGRPEAADLMLTLTGMQAEADWQQVGTALDRLLRIRDELDAVIAEMRDQGSGPPSSAPGVRVIGPDK